MWIAGYNMPGYLAGAEPSEHEDWEEARDAIVWVLDQALEHEEDNQTEKKIHKFIALLERSDEPQEVGFNVGGYHYFITQA